MEEALHVRAFGISTGSWAGDGDLAEAAKGDPHAFGELYERYYAPVYRYVYHRTNHVSDAEDLTAVVFMKALEALPGYRSRPSGFAPWLFRIARNTVVDHYRKKRIDVRQPEPRREEADLSSDPASQVIGQERLNELGELVRCLSPDQREVVLLRYAADLSYEEIAAVLNKNEPAIRMLVHRGLRKLKEVLSDQRP